MTLKAKINPENEAATYHFEYTDDADFQVNSWTNAQQVPAVDANLSAGGMPIAVSRHVTGLSPSTLYHWRAVASNGTGTTEGDEKTFTTLDPGPGACPNDEFRVGPSADLPDCRAYELVSPADSGGVTPSGRSGFAGLTVRYGAAPSGDAVAFATTGQDLPGFHGNGFNDLYTSTRGADDWTTSFVGPNGAEAERPNLDLTSPDLSTPPG